MIGTWIIAIGLCLVPLSFLAFKNPRALPIGALFVALVFSGGMGALIVGNSTFNPGSGTESIARSVVAVLLVLVVLIGLNLWWMQGSFASRVNWMMVSGMIWLGVVGVLDFAYGKSRIEASSREIVAATNEALQREEGYARLRKALDRTPERRRAVLDQVLAAVQSKTSEHFIKFDRWVVFGDAAEAPESVTVWLVIEERADYPGYFEGFNMGAERMHRLMNFHLHQAGYPGRLAMGVTTVPAVEEAGGERSYFGANGERLIPQIPAEHRAEASSGAFQLTYPRRRPK